MPATRKTAGFNTTKASVTVPAMAVLLWQSFSDSQPSINIFACSICSETPSSWASLCHNTTSQWWKLNPLTHTQNCLEINFRQIFTVVIMQEIHRIMHAVGTECSNQADHTNTSHTFSVKCTGCLSDVELNSSSPHSRSRHCKFWHQRVCQMNAS